MDEMDMLAPLAVTFFCTTVGLVVFFTCPYAYFDLLPHPGLGTAEDIKLRDELLSLSVSQLRHRAKEAKIPDEDIGIALDQVWPAASSLPVRTERNLIHCAACTRSRATWLPLLS